MKVGSVIYLVIFRFLSERFIPFLKVPPFVGAYRSPTQTSRETIELFSKQIGIEERVSIQIAR